MVSNVDLKTTGKTLQCSNSTPLQLFLNEMVNAVNQGLIFKAGFKVWMSGIKIALNSYRVLIIGTRVYVK